MQLLRCQRLAVKQSTNIPFRSIEERPIRRLAPGRGLRYYHFLPIIVGIGQMKQRLPILSMNTPSECFWC